MPLTSIVVAVHHQSPGHDEGGQPGLERAGEQGPVREIDPPFRVVILIVGLGPANVQHGAGLYG